MANMYRLVYDRSRRTAEGDGANRQTASLAGLAVALFLIVACLFLIRHLHHATAIEDCLMEGRTNCLPIASIRPQPRL